MTDPSKIPAEPKKGELNDDELDAVTGGAVDAFIWFTPYDGNSTQTEQANVIKGSQQVRNSTKTG